MITPAISIENPKLGAISALVDKQTDTEVIEDIVPLYNISVSVKCDNPSKVVLVPQNEEIDFTYDDGKVSFNVPKVNVHQMVSIEG